jgi:hypothetical protein
MNREQLGVCTLVASHTGATKKKVIQEAEEFLIFSEMAPVIELSNTLHLKFAVSKETLPIGKIMSFKTFEKSLLYSDIINFSVNAFVDFVAFYSKGTLLSAYAAKEYTGLGGIFVRSPDDDNGVVIEPLKNYLLVNHPRSIED